MDDFPFLDKVPPDTLTIILKTNLKIIFVLMILQYYQHLYLNYIPFNKSTYSLPLSSRVSDLAQCNQNPKGTTFFIMRSF